MVGASVIVPSVVSTCAVVSVGVGVTLVIVSDSVATVEEAAVGSARKESIYFRGQSAIFKASFLYSKYGLFIC